MDNPKGQYPQYPLRRPRRGGLVALVLLCLLCAWVTVTTQQLGASVSLEPADLTAYESLAGHCSKISPISSQEYYRRQSALAAVLSELGHPSANNIYVAEPGANSQYFANFSQANWRLSERPLLFVMTKNGHIVVLTPKFETTRAKQLPISHGSDITFVEWAEEEDPYLTLVSALPSLANSTIYVDGSVRKFISDGLANAAIGAQVKSAPPAVTQLRERKTEAELDILKCANEATVLAIRHVHQQLFVGIKESEARNMMAKALASAGLTGGGCLTLFGGMSPNNAALPHGSGTDRSLTSKAFALFDCTASLHGYESDVTRTVALAASSISEEDMKIWELVKSAQEIAIATAKKGTLARNVDQAARAFLIEAGYGNYFTHRLGHGIGIEGHEAPYLRGGSANNAVLETGHTFSNEPGIYIEGKIGVRLEDCFYIKADGSAAYLTEGVGGPSASPWEP